MSEILTILLGGLTKLPAGAIRRSLTLAAPAFRWTCGEHDTGSEDCAAPLSAETLVLGRGEAATVFMQVRPCDPPADAPIGGMALTVARPEAPTRQAAEAIMLAVASGVLTANPDARARFGAGPWLDPATVNQIGRKVLDGGSLDACLAALAPSIPNPFAAPAHGSADEFASMPYEDRMPRERSAILGIDVLGLAQARDVMVRTVNARLGAIAGQLPGYANPPEWTHEEVRRDRLPTLVALYDAPPAIDFVLLAEGLAAIDPEGGWHVDAAAFRALGRGATISLVLDERPLPGFALELALDRSFWCRSGEPLRRLRRHRTALVLACDLDTETADWIDVRQCAKALAMALALAARSGPLAGVFLPAHGCVYTADFADALVAPLASEEVPIKLFLWTAFRSTETDAVSLSTAGLLPFVGREVEAWNAPGSLEFVGEKLNDLLRYLLIEGPVVRHGDTIGIDPDDRSVRVCHGESLDTTRAASVPVLLMELAGPAPGPPRAEATPMRPEPGPAPACGSPLPASLSTAAPSSASPSPMPTPPVATRPAAFGRRNPGGFGRKGL